MRAARRRPGASRCGRHRRRALSPPPGRARAPGRPADRCSSESPAHGCASPSLENVVCPCFWPVVVGAVVVHENVVRRALEVVELPGMERAPERPAGHEYEGDRDGNEEVEAFHAGLAASGRNAFTRTMSELAPMASAASQAPIHPAAASGSAAAL